MDLSELTDVSARDARLDAHQAKHTVHDAGLAGARRSLADPAT